MRVKWQEGRWGDLATLEYGRALRGYDTAGGPFRVFGTNGPIGWHDKALCPHPSIVIGRKGAYRGIHYSAEPFFVIDTAFYLKPKTKLDVRWAYYELLTRDINGMDSGSAIPSTNREDFYSLPVTVPPLPEQRAIAHILGTLDDKIELNRRMNETLEAMARALFKSWFVDFDPVRAKMEGRDPGLPQHLADLFPARLVPSELDPIPEGWEVSEIGEEVNAVGGATPSTKEPAYWNGGQQHWATPKDLSKLLSPVLLETDRKITEAGVKKISSGLLPIGTVLLSSRAPIGYLAIAEVPTAVNQGFIAMVCEKRLPNLYVLFWCYENLDHIKDIAGGSTFAEISKKAFRPVPVVVPSEEVLAVYEDKVRLLYDRIVANTKESVLLVSLRDTLLPKLISGELAVVRMQSGSSGGQIMTIRPLLFDNMERTDASSKQHNEPLFAYLNRSARREATETRGRLESWFERFPVEAQHDVRERFRGDDDHAHQGAVFELLMHELLIRLDCRVEVHPDIPGTGSRPDFLARHGDCRFYIEATVVDPKRSLSASRPLEKDVVAKINELTSPHFYIWARVDGELSRALSREQVIQPFARLLRDHDPDEVQRLIDERGTHAAPFEKIEHGTWSLHGWLRPLPPEKRGYGRLRTLVIGPARSGMIDSSTPVQSAIQKKAKKYGRLDAPLVVAVNARDPFFDKDDEIGSLFGEEQVTFVKDRPDLPVKLTRKDDGVWIQGGYKPRYTRLAAVLIFRNIAPWNLCDARSCLYVNPDVDYTKLPDVLYRLPHARALETKIPHQYEIQWFEGENIGQLLGVGEDWQTKA